MNNSEKSISPLLQLIIGLVLSFVVIVVALAVLSKVDKTQERADEFCSNKTDGTVFVVSKNLNFTCNNGHGEGWFTETVSTTSLDALGWGKWE